MCCVSAGSQELNNSAEETKQEPVITVSEPSTSPNLPDSPKNKWLALHGEFRSEIAHRVADLDEYDISKLKNFAYLDLTGKFSRSVSFNVSTRMYYDAVFDLTNAFNENVERDQQWDAELRNAFVDIGFGPFEMRLGKQQIVWGQAVNLFFADIVNPRDLREFVLPDLDDIRIPVWAADVEYYFGDTHMEFVWIPVLDHSRIGVPGSDFAFRTPALPPETVLNVAGVKVPANNARNGVYGFRLSQYIKGWDLSAFYLYGYDYFPTFFRTIETNPETLVTTVNVKPEISRKRTVGATFSKEVSNVILKGEFVYDRERNFIVTDPSDFDGITKSDYFEYLVGMDYTFFEKLDFNVQFFQQYILKPVDTLFQDDQASFISTWLKTGFINNRFEPEFFGVAKLDGNKKDYMLRPKLNFAIGDHWKSAIGADLFVGDSDGEFGQFDGADRAYLEIRCRF